MLLVILSIIKFCEVKLMDLCSTASGGAKRRQQPGRVQCKVFGREAGPQSKLGNDEDWLIGQD